MSQTLILASASPRRQELLTQIGISHQVYAVDIDETPKDNEAPSHLVARLAKEKADAAFTLIGKADTVILAADTIIEFNGHAVGKPRDEEDAVATLLALSDKVHHVSTAFCLVSARDRFIQTVTSEIRFGTISEHQARRYWHTGEPKDKAGSYAIQGKAAVFVKQLTGSYSAVVGLPLYECQQALTQFGVME